MQAAVQQILTTVSATSSRVVDALGMLALSAKSNAQRQAYMSAQFDLQRKLSGFNITFTTVLNEKVAQEINPRIGSRNIAATDWSTLSLVGDSEVEEEVTAHRLGLEIEHECEWELRELDAYMGSLLGGGRPDPERNPIRPDIIGKALFRAIEGATPEVSIRKTLASELGHGLAKAMRQCYVAIVADLSARGIQPVGLAVRATTISGTGGVTAPAIPLRPDLVQQDQRLAAQALSAMFGVATPTGFGGSGHGELGGPVSGPGALRAAPNPPWASSASGFPATPSGGHSAMGAGSFPSGHGAMSGAGATSSGHGALAGSGGFPPGHGGMSRGGAYPVGHAGMGGDGAFAPGLDALSDAGSPASGHGGIGGGYMGPDARMRDVIKRLAFLTSESGGALDPVPQAHWNPSSPGSMGGATSLGAGSHGHGVSSQPGALHSGISGMMAINLIRAHREELVRASTGALDHMVIDIVASLFDQILSDPKVPPQMARQIARLQLPVLRVALRDMQFFSMRSHPVRRFVNRLASVACAFEDFDEGPGKRFLSLVRELVQQVVEGDFDQMELYDSKLRALEAFVEEEAQDEAQAHAEAVELLANKEAQLRVLHRYELLVQAALAPMALQQFVRDFIVHAWSQVEVEATLKHGTASEIAERMRQAARELILSVQPKNSPTERKQFILALPHLMKTLNEGLALIAWPEDRKKAFLAELLPCHAQSIKSPSLTDFQRRQLEFQLQALDKLVVPDPHDVPQSEMLAIETAPDTSFSPQEAEKLGLVPEASIDWEGKVDIDLALLDAATGDLDINLAELEPEMRPETPTQGASLVQHVQAGVAYQMHIDAEWKKVRLNWVSPGRTFFIFSHGKKHQTIVSLTGRMLTKLCETGRFRAFEQAYLIERAVVRARKQLAALSAGSTKS